MQTLGLDGAPPPQPWYKLWLWPDVTEPGDAVAAARNGAIGAIAIGLLQCVIGTIAHGPAAIFSGAFYLLAAIGIRQLSFPASAMTLTLFAVSMIAAISKKATPSVIELALSALLIGAVRASWHALQMSAQDRAQLANDSPLETWTQQALLQMGSPFWRKIRILFNIGMALYFALLLTGVAMLLLQ